MARSLPPLAWLRAFEAAARRSSFTAAADELGVTQSAISQQVRLLERRFGVALFARKARGVALTDQGRTLLPKVGAALDQLARATAPFERGPSAGVLTIASSVSVARWLLAPRLHEFMAQHPGLRARLIGAIWPDEFELAVADVEIRFGSALQAGADAERLEPDALIAVGPPQVAGSLAEQPLIEAVGASEGWRDWARGAGRAELAAPTLFVDNYGAALDLAAGGAGVALASSLLAAAPLASGALARVHDHALPSTEGYFLAFDDSAPAAVSFAAWLRALVHRSH